MKTFDISPQKLKSVVTLEELYELVTLGLIKFDYGIICGVAFNSLLEFDGFEKRFDSYETDEDLFFVQSELGVFHMIDYHKDGHHAAFKSAMLRFYTHDDGVEEENEYA